MPFDSTTFAPARTADPLDLDAMIAWLETMPAEGEYDYSLASGCVICRFLRSSGFPHAEVNDNYVTPEDDIWARGARRVPLPQGWREAAAGTAERGIYAYHLWTYGAALSRFRALREG